MTIKYQLFHPDKSLIEKKQLATVLESGLVPKEKPEDLVMEMTPEAAKRVMESINEFVFYSVAFFVFVVYVGVCIILYIQHDQQK